MWKEGTLSCKQAEAIARGMHSKFSLILPVTACRRFNATDARTLRAAVSTFCDLLALVTRTLEMFGQNSTLQS